MAEVIRVLQFGTHNEDCGIAKYQEQFVKEFNKLGEIQTEYFEHSPNMIKVMSNEEQELVFKELAQKLVDFDILHIQHELSFFKRNELDRIINLSLGLGKKVVVTVHTAPAAQFRSARLGGLGPKSLLHYAKSRISGKRFIDKYFTPLNKVNLVVTHNNPTKQDLIAHGLDSEKIQVIRHPVPVVASTAKSNEITGVLRTGNKDVIYATIGFLSRSKGILHAVKALSLLPENYKLAIIGGMHPDTEDTVFYDEVTDLIQSLKLNDRVYITGFIEDDERLYALVREVDICAYPYDRNYYSFVSSGSLNIAIANHKPVVSYATNSFLEINSEAEVVDFCQSPNYYELAREIQNLDMGHYSKMSEMYAKKYAWDAEAKNFVDIYKNVASM